MSKWADYCITAVRYHEPRTAILEVEIRPDTGTQLGATQRVSRAAVVNAIRTGTTFVTAYMRNGQWFRGEDVRIFQIHGEEYLRTDRDYTRADNLGSLPQY